MKLSESTIAAYEKTIASIERQLGGVSVQKAAPEALLGVLRSYQAKEVTPMFLKKMKAALQWRLADPGLPLWEEMAALIRGYQGGHERVEKLPFSLEQIKLLCDAAGTDEAGVRDRALLLVGFAGMYGRDIIRLSCEGIERTPQGIILEGHRHIDRTGSRWCPVDALEEWLRVSGIVTGPVFRRVLESGAVGNDALNEAGLAFIIKRMVRSIGLPEESYAVKSLQHGAIRMAVQRRVPATTIARQSGLTLTRVKYLYERFTTTEDPLAGIW